MRRRLHGVFDSVVADIRAAKWASWGDHFSDDARYFATGAPAFVGRGTIANWGKSLPPLESFSVGPAEVHGDASLAWAWSAVYLKFRDLPADTAKQLVVFRRGADRKWVIQAVSINTDLPMSAPAQRVTLHAVKRGSSSVASTRR